MKTASAVGRALSVSCCLGESFVWARAAYFIEKGGGCLQTVRFPCLRRGGNEGRELRFRLSVMLRPEMDLVLSGVVMVWRFVVMAFHNF
jgi:hypothetical protein